MANNIERPPLLRVLRAARWGLTIGEARYYGWQVFLQFGPLAIYVWPAAESAMAQSLDDNRGS